MHDGPLTKPTGKPELGTPFLHVAGRAGSSADNAQASAMFMINDEGVWIIKRPQGREAMDLLAGLPPRWEDRTEADWLAYAGAVKRKVYDQRFEFPREWPYYLGWNAQFSNVPGSTCFLPVVDNTRQYINVLLILLSEPHGKAPLFIDDWSPFRPKNPSRVTSTHRTPTSIRRRAARQPRPKGLSPYSATTLAGSCETSKALSCSEVIITRARARVSRCRVDLTSRLAAAGERPLDDLQVVHPGLVASAGDRGRDVG